LIEKAGSIYISPVKRLAGKSAITCASKMLNSTQINFICLCPWYVPKVTCQVSLYLFQYTQCPRDLGHITPTRGQVLIVKQLMNQINWVQADQSLIYTTVCLSVTTYHI